MPAPKKKRTTSKTDPLALEQASSLLANQQTFHEHLRALTRDGVRVVIEEVMREELKQFLGAAWGECTPERKGYRNGTYSGIWRPRPVPSKILRSLEIEKDASIPRSLIETRAMNRRWPKG